MDQSKLAEKLKNHEIWLRGEGGKRADLRRAKFRGADFRWADLRKADLRWADLQEADFRGADLRGANLQKADLQQADFRGADLRGVNFQWADLRRADLRGANLQWADLQGTFVKEFKFQKHQAICTGNRITIGCEDHSLLEWLDHYEVIGELNDYTDEQIMAYGTFIELCAKLEKI